MKKIIVGLLVAAVTAAIAVPLAVAGGGNSDAANACKQAGWQNLVSQDGKGFKNQGDCVSYVVHGGVTTAKSTPAPHSATGNVTWDLAGTGITGSVVFNANATGGSLHYENSNEMWLDGVVTSYRQVNANTAVFVGTITDGSSDFVNYTDPDVFYVKVVDGGSNGDQIAVLANQPGFNDANAINADWDMSVAHGDVTSGNLVVN